MSLVQPRATKKFTSFCKVFKIKEEKIKFADRVFWGRKEMNQNISWDTFYYGSSQLRKKQKVLMKKLIKLSWGDNNIYDMMREEGRQGHPHNTQVGE